MAAKILTARRTQTQAVVVVHLDSTKLVDGNPDPDWVRTFRIPLSNKAPGETNPEFWARIRAQIRDDVNTELDQRQPTTAGTSLGADGEDL